MSVWSENRKCVRRWRTRAVDRYTPYYETTQAHLLEETGDPAADAAAPAHSPEELPLALSPDARDDVEQRRVEIEQRVEEDGDALVMLTGRGAHRAQQHADARPAPAIYEWGSVPGCHDDAVFATIAYYEMVGLSSVKTRERGVEWLRESGAWASGGFEAASPEGLVDDKRHVYEQRYGWKEKARAAKRVIERRA